LHFDAPNVTPAAPGARWSLSTNTLSGDWLASLRRQPREMPIPAAKIMKNAALSNEHEEMAHVCESRLWSKDAKSFERRRLFSRAIYAIECFAEN
jgi:hypothetical protein